MSATLEGLTTASTHTPSPAEQAAGEERLARLARQAEARARAEAVRRDWSERVRSGAVRLPSPRPELLVA